MSAEIARWGELVGIAGASEESDLIGFFQFFRPDGAGLAAVFEGLPFGQEVLDRLLRIYQCTAIGFDGTQAYFLPTPKVECADSIARDLLDSHFSEMGQIAQQRKDDDLIALLSNVQPRRVESQAELRALP